MRTVMLLAAFALSPGLVATIAWQGWGVVLHVVIALLTAVACETLAALLRGRSPRMNLGDGSGGVAALIFALGVPPYAPWWVTVAALSFGLLIAKHAYGGLGQNLFNPAMAGYAFALLAFPAHMQGWVAAEAPGPALADSLALVFGGGMPADAVSGATPLTGVQTEVALMHMLSEPQAARYFGSFGGAGAEWIAAAFLVGGLGLIALGVIRWQAPAGMLTAVVLLAAVFHGADPDRYPDVVFHLFSGALMLGAFFVATDPVTTPATPLGRLLFGLGAGILVYAIRSFGAQPDGVAFAILMMNCATPLIDRWTALRARASQAS